MATPAAVPAEYPQMAIINEKAGLMKDFIELTPVFPDKAKSLGPLAAIVSAVERCRTITHRLLRLAKRMDVEMEVLGVNEVLQESAGFLEKEALHRNIKFHLHLEPNLPRIESDRGQLQQVFLNILNNAFAALENGVTARLEALGVSIAFAQADASNLDEARMSFRARVIKNAEARVKDIMLKIKGTIQADADLMEALKLLYRNKITVIPVYDGDKVIGVLRESDLFLTVAEILTEA